MGQQTSIAIPAAEAHEEGRKANECGYYKHSNPFLGTDEHLALHWDRGWDEHQSVRDEWECANHERARRWAA